MPYAYKSVKDLDTHLATRSYVSGYQASTDDLTVFMALAGAPPAAAATPHAARWYAHISALVASTFPGTPEGVTGVSGAAAAPAAAAAAAPSKKDKKKGGEDGGKKGPPSAEEIAAMKAAKQAEIEKKLIKDVTKEGGKKGVEIEGAADMGGLEFFCTTMEKPDGELKFLKMSMEAMNEVPDPDGEERRGGSGHVGKMLFSAGTEAMSMVAYVPKDKQNRINATEWLKSVCGDAGVKGELQAGGDAGLATAIAKANPDAGMFTIKMKDAAMAHGFSYLRERGCFPEDTGDDDDDDGEYVYGDDDFPS
ncbi:hypothetical protein PPROV_000444800 [Pycnococcus provasolii]|uniref:Uncharacterized protein n=1 Tax=Pycnococcus provasolii TaxID=41880 RepID=A0A830HFW7_9CHLO|nr:hypothetical protein PPROV_000444800 [Pycnococcus provasolii]